MKQKENKLSEDIIKHNALSWWNKLSKLKQKYYEYSTFGYGEPFEDNSLSEGDIIKMFLKYV